MNEDYQDYHDYQGHHDNHPNASLNDSYDDALYDDYHSVCDKASVRSFGGVFLPLVYAGVLLLGLAGNGLVVLVYTSGGRLRTLTDACLLNLAAADLLLLLTLPLWAADAVQGWRLGAGLCKLTAFLHSANFSCGMFLLAGVSVDRHLALAHAVAGRAWLAGGGSGRRRRWLLACAAAWASALLLGLPDLIFSQVRHTSHGRPACVAVLPPGMARPARAALELLEVALRFLLPFGVMAACYGRLAWALGRAEGVRRDRKWRALRVLLAVVAAFLLTQLPYNVVKLWRALDAAYALVTDCGRSKALDHALQVTESLALTHACVNPVLYACVGSSFRGRVLRAAKRLGVRLGRSRSPAQEPAVEMALRSPDRTHSHSDSEEGATSTFTI